ncbi:MAG: GmrSD restriction endonuclease domain-containing protein [Candidatus Nanopelagicales bacterium]
MQTYIRTPQEVFINPQRLLVPLFQRQYVWDLEPQWKPLWEDVSRQADVIADGRIQHLKPHFLGAVVLQGPSASIGGLTEWSVIDGQQRLTTLQLLLDAAHAIMIEQGAIQAAARLEPVIRNATSWTTVEEHQLKIWPTNRDRPAFSEVMRAAPPVDYGSLKNHGERLVKAHAYFAAAAREYVNRDPQTRGDALALALLQGLQLVVIQLDTDDDSQEIFETLNGRMTILTAADLIKNLLFQRLAQQGADTEVLYAKYWQRFEEPFWERMVSRGRFSLPRISMFLSDYLVSQTVEEVRVSEVFRNFKRFIAEHPSAQDLPAWLAKLADHADAYRKLVEASEVLDGDIAQDALFQYRLQCLDTEVVNPTLLWIIDPTLASIPAAQKKLALASLESWLVRRALVAATSKANNRMFIELLGRLHTEPRESAGDVIRDFLAGQRAVTSYWPGDAEVLEEMTSTAIYRRLPRARLRMTLEAIEDHLRGYTKGTKGSAEYRLPRGQCTIEHVMPQAWATHWRDRNRDELVRNLAVQTLGNLTLVTQKLNSELSNAPWQEKRKTLNERSVTLMKTAIIEKDEWNEEEIADRGRAMVRAISAVWPIPKSAPGVPTVLPFTGTVGIPELLTSGALHAGQVLTGRGGEHQKATVLGDGGFDVAGVRYGSPSAAGRAVTGRATNGWWHWLVDADKRLCLSDLLREYQAMETDTVIEDSD